MKTSSHTIYISVIVILVVLCGFSFLQLARNNQEADFEIVNMISKNQEINRKYGLEYAEHNLTKKKLDSVSNELKLCLEK